MSLRVVKTREFEPSWNDRGSRAPKDVGFWMPKAQGNLLPLGSVVVQGFDDINGRREAILVGERTPGDGTLAHPYAFRKFWSSEGTSCKQPGTIWRPVPPTGYTSFGEVAWSGFEEPPLTSIWCVKRDLTKGAAVASGSIWEYKKSGETTPVVSCWEVHGAIREPNLLGNFWFDVKSFVPEANYPTALRPDGLIWMTG